MRIRLTARWLLPLLVVAATPWAGRGESFSALRFEQYLESLRQQAGIPGLSAAIVQDRAVAWERGFGLADMERNLPATPDTAYAIGGLTSMISAVQILQCVERGLVRLDEPATVLLPTFGERTSTLRDVLAHVTPDRRFLYDLSRYDVVAAGIKECTEQTLRYALAADVFARLGMDRSVPGHDFATWSEGTRAQFDPAVLARYTAVMAGMAKSYKSNGRGKPSPTVFSPQTGLKGGSGAVSSAHDLAKLQSALDSHVMLFPETMAATLRAPALWDGGASPHGLGRFVQVYEGELVVWQFGVIPDAYSALQMTLPQRGVTLILLANSDGLVEPFPLANGDVSASPFARLFLRLFS